MSNDARPEAFAEAAKSGLTAANAATLATCTLVGGSLSVFADVAPSDWNHVMGVVALASWLFSITLALYLAGRSTRPQEPRGLLTTVADGVRLAGAKPGIAAMVVLMTAGAAFTVWSRMHSDQGSVLRSLVATQERAAAAAETAAERTASIQADTQAIRSAVGRPATPAELLANMGYGTRNEDVCRAISTGAVKALQLMEKIAEFKARLSVALGGGQYALCIEEALAEPARGPAVARALQEIEVSAEDVNRLYVAQSHTGLKVTAGGKPAQLAIVTDDGEVIAVGESVAMEAEAVSINAYRNFLAGKGYLKVYSKPLQSRPNASDTDALPRSERE